MWADSETARDFLNFSDVAESVAEIIVQAEGRPVSIGVSGAWGTGKSSMLKLIRCALNDREGSDGREFVFVEFNAWLYQGFDDARAALMEVIAAALEEEAKKRKRGLEKARELAGRVDWLRAVKLGAGTAAALALGLPPVGAVGEILALGKSLVSGGADQEALEGASDAVSEVGKEASGLLKPKKTWSPPKEIHALRECFEKTLNELGVTLVVLIDDLDRCLPATTISTLEAIRLFLFLESTAFVIAADDGMIKHAVRRHFEGFDEGLATSYFDKLVQVPLRVPPLGIQEVRSYLILLFTDNSTLGIDEKDRIREQVCNQLGQSWQGKRVDRAFVESLQVNLPPELIARFETSDRLAPLMTSASQIAGNPRLIKRFLNALSIRMAIAKAHGVGVDEAALAKMLLFERCGDPGAYTDLARKVAEADDGKPSFLGPWEEAARSGEKPDVPDNWKGDFVREWLTIPPSLSDVDVRGILYVSREHAAVIAPEDMLSSEGVELLTALLENPELAEALKSRLKALSKTETTVIMGRLLDRARQEQEWGVPPILHACMAVAECEPGQGVRIGSFLTERPPSQIRPSIVPKIADQPWALQVLEYWESAAVNEPVKRAISQRRKGGNVTK